ncbi:TetR/AcrR family transcriptional regulator [Neisseriaceae bacterium TC5R-5]|nr:TetR/AcrR family transcriptional regulator [Neisseriaceae bacterium TC5R-5]
MANAKKIEDAELLQRLSTVFKNYGYEGASLTIMSVATGLKKPSLYHRFPNGKEQMASETLSFIRAWLAEHISVLLEEELPPQKRFANFIREMNGLYEGGNESCLLNMLTLPRHNASSLGKAISDIMMQLIFTLSTLAQTAGISKEWADHNAEQVLIELQGALVICRGLNNSAPFERMLQRLPTILFNEH